MILPGRTNNMRRHITAVKSVGAIPCALALGASFLMLTSCGSRYEESSSEAVTTVISEVSYGTVTSTESSTLTSTGTQQTKETTAAKTTKKTTSSKAVGPDEDKNSDSVTTTTQQANADQNTVTQMTEQQNVTTTAPQQTGETVQENDKPDANTTAATTKATIATAKESRRVTTAQLPESEPANDFHLYEDGYVTKYDEMKLKNLTDEQREAYDALSAGIWSMQPDIAIPYGSIKRNEAADFLYAVLGTMPEVNYVTGTYRVSVSGGYIKKYSIDYSLSKEDAADQHSRLREAAAKIIGSLDSSMSDYDKVKYFHDYIIKNCEYNSDKTSCYSAYGCLVEGKAVCEGYAMALDYLCEKAGKYSLLESGTSINSQGEEIAHIWNKVLINRRWYNFDFTWDDPVSAFGSDYVKYDYFGITDDEISRNHTVVKNPFLYYPSATATVDNYFKRNGLYAKSRDDIEEMFISAFVISLEEGTTGASIKCSDEELLEYANELALSRDEQADEQLVYMWLSEATDNTGIQQSYKGFYLVKNELLGTIMIVLKQ